LGQRVTISFILTEGVARPPIPLRDNLGTEAGQVCSQGQAATSSEQLNATHTRDGSRAEVPTSHCNADKLGHTVSMGESWASSEAVRASMRANRRRDTRPEVRVRRAAHALGLRYRVDMRPVPSLRVRADMVFTRAKVAVFIDGCFWHGCPVHYRPASKNSAFWSAKLTENRTRDARTTASLVAAGWSVIRAWEHEDPQAVASQIALTVKKSHALGQGCLTE
jgi:DNA mismatch endonuclease (patch repair protein)